MANLRCVLLITQLLCIYCTISRSVLLPDSPRLKTLNGHLILESAPGRNISFLTRGSGSVSVNGVDVARTYNLIEAVRPQLETLHQSSLEFLIRNLSSVVQNLATETRLAETLDEFRGNFRTANEDRNNLRSTVETYQQQMMILRANVSQLSSVSMTEDKERMIRNLTQMFNQMRNGEFSGAAPSNRDIQAIQQTLSRIQDQIADLPLLEDRVSSLEYSAGNGTGGGGRVSTTIEVDVRRLQISVRRIRLDLNLLRRAVNRNDCQSNPCQHGGTCIDTTRGFLCLCPKEYEGLSCQEDVNECAAFIGTDIGCQNGATCRNTEGSYTCTCAPGWYGIHCTQRTDSCSTSSSTALCGHGTCIPTAKDGHPYTCLCDQGWTKPPGSPACSEDVNECSASRPPCSHDPLVICINIPGSFICGPCPQGYEGNGFVCRDIDECSANNGGCSLIPRVECINTRPGRRCGPCPSGYTGDGTICLPLPRPCSSNPCHPMAVCVDNPQMSATYYTCTCTYGYTGNGMGSAGCMPFSQTGGGSGGEVSPSGNPCAGNPCLHGMCSVYMGQYRCTCTYGYTGQNCDQVLDMCSSSPCLNGGTCTSSLGAFTCDCPSTHTGDRCQTINRRCGGRLRGHSGVVDYPGEGQATYQHNISCAWVISVNRSLVITVNFSSFHLEPAPRSCRYDWLQIHDGPRSDAHLIGRFCGREFPGQNGTIVSTHNHLYMWFRSDHSHAGSGFTFTWNATEPECGGDIFGQEHGAINSPGYPGRYPVLRDCYWTVQVPRGKKIQFAFATLQLEHHPNCSFDYLDIRDGLTANDTVLARFCSTQTPSPVVTSASEAFIHFHSDESLRDTGFHITFVALPGIPGCGGLLTGDVGEFSLPTVAREYSNYVQCEWEIRVPPGNIINMNFTQFTVEYHSSCIWDFVEVRDGGQRDSPLIGRFCGTQIPPPVVSSSNRLFIFFHSDSSLGYEGFTVRYEVACGGEYTAETGVIQSPYFPRSYPHNRICIYVIKQIPGKAVVMNFTNFDLEDGRTFEHETGLRTTVCSYDYLEIRDGLADSSPLMGRYCGPSHRVPSVIISSLNGLFLKFKTDGSVSNRGFSATYSTIDIACGGIHHALTGTISFPDNSESYPGNTDCRWVIDMPQGYVIQVTWQTFALEHHEGCSYDYVEVFDNSSAPNSAGPVSGRRYCGRSMPPIMTSMGNIMTIHFHSDASQNHDGFALAYHAFDASRVCSGHYHSSSGRIRSPNFPSHYPNDRTCEWTITVPVNIQIRLNFTTFDLEPSYRECSYDYLEIRNGGYETSPLLIQLCGYNRTIDDIFSHTHQLYLKFHSDASVTGTGFELFWDEMATGCGGSLTSTSGELSSPGYPQPFHRYADCFWTIRGNPGSFLSLTFIDMDLEYEPTCHDSVIEVRDGSRSTSNLIGRYCSSQGLLSVNSTGSDMSVKFRSGWTVGKRGFRARYHAVCNTVLKKPFGVIESPHFPSLYPHDRNCTWVIMAPRGNAINISFSHFDVEDPISATSGVCEYDYVELRVGHRNSPQRTVKGHYCGSQIPPQFYSGQGMDVAEVHFTSDRTVAHNGFRLEWVVHACGGVFEDFYGNFQSANYPNAYPTNTDCEWHFIAPPGLRIKITIEEFDIESSFSPTECTFDSLKIYGGRDTTSPTLLTLCHKEHAAKTVTTQGNNALMVMVSDGSVRGKGFRGHYKVLTEGGCGGEFTAPKGEIHSPGYPSNYDNHADCIWTITMDQNHVVEFEFKDFDVEPHSNCSYDYLALFDGDTVDSPVLSQHCGAGIPVPAVVRSSGRYMTVRLKADGSSTGRGFKAEYRKGCGATIDVPLELENNAITSPNFPHMFTVHTNCTWHLKAQQGYKVMLRFTHLNIHQSAGLPITNESCTNDYVKIFDGDGTTSPEIGRYCGSHVPRPLFSTSEYLTVQLFTLMGYGVGFRALYTSLDTACGGELSSFSGEVASPNYPDSYPMSSECVWTISAGEGNRIQLTFLNFNIEESDGCNLDYLEIHEKSAAGALLMHNCSSTLPEPITAFGSLWMLFKSDDQDTGRGFLATYTILTSSELTAESGIIESPLYPHIFTGVNEFTWYISIGLWKHISITIEDISIEVNPVDDVCFSSLVIHDGPDAYAAVLTTLCGHSLPSEPIVSSRNSVFIRFIANLKHEGSSFRLRYQTVDERPSTGITAVPQGPHPNCTFLIYVNSSTQFSSPNYPDNYDNNMKCEWIIQTDSHSRLKLYLHYELEESSDCVFDKIEIFDGIDGRRSWNKTHTLCRRDQSIRYVYSTGRFMRVYFQTDISQTKKGFTATVYKACGGVLYDTDGVITSPNYPENYGRNSNCEWKMKMRQGRTIQLIFDDFQIANATPTCTDDYLLIYNGPTTSFPFLGTGKFCGRSPSPIQETSSNTALLKFKSDVQNSDKGFHITYHEISAACGGSLQLTNDMKSIIITSPNYPNPPHPHTECVWVVTGPPNKPIRVHFIDHFDITWSVSCENAFVEVKDGGTNLAPSLTNRRCGRMLPNTVTSTDNVVYIRYYTNADSVHAGFKAEVAIGRCGGVYRAYGGYLSSPNYPEPYDPEMNCTWHVIGPLGHYLIFVFQEINIYNPSENCSSSEYGVLTLNDTVGNNSLSLCTEGISYPPFETAANNASIIFTNNHTGGTINRFKLTVTASIESCGGILTGTEGVIQSPGYPHGMSHIWNCAWIIQGPPGSSVTLTFEDMDLTKYGNFYCLAIVKVFNGIERYSPALTGRLCGSEIPPDVSSSMSNMKVSMKVYRPSYNRGFKARWTTTQSQECGGVLTETSGIISSPGLENGGYNHSLFCVWTINNPDPSSNSTNITISYLHLEGRCYDYILFEGFNPTGEVVTTKKVCHGEENLRFVSPYPTTRIIFASDRSINGTGFRLSYSPSYCGGYHVGPEVTVTSPGHPSSYPPDSHCAWLFDFMEGSQVEIDFTSFQLENSINHDYVKVYNGPEITSPVIGHYTGTTSPGRVGPSMSDSVLVTFESDGTNSGSGFSAIVRSHTRGCGGVVHGISGNISSPGYSANSNYPSNTGCIWEIRMEAGYQVKASFVERFELETSPDCQNDYVQLAVSSFSADGVQQLSSPTRFCGRQIPPVFRANSSVIQVQLVTNNAVEGKGFKLHYVGECGGTYGDSEGVIMSPLHPNPYPSRVICIYRINALANSFVVLNFSSFSIRKSYFSGCVREKLLVQQYAEQDLLVTRQTLCGREVPDRVVLRGPVVLNFSSNYFVPSPIYTGFMLTYSVKACGGNITQPGLIQLPMYPARYVRHMNCVWDITAPDGYVVYIKFLSLDLEYHRNCDFDYISIYDGLTSNEDKLISKLCGNHTGDPPIVTSVSSTARIIFNSDASYAPSHGFEAVAEFTHKCGEVVNISSAQSTQTIRSLDANNDGTYERLLNCQWLVVASADTVVTLNFTRFDIEGPLENDTVPCPYDFVKVFDGPSKFSPLLGTFCGSTLPQRATVGSRNIMLVIFYSDSQTEMAGFTATLSSAPRRCGAATLTATDTPQALESPGYPDNYPVSLRCHWLIVGPEEQTIALHINEFSLQQSPGCSADRLFIGESYETQNAFRTDTGARSTLSWTVNLNGRRASFSSGSNLEHSYCGSHFPHSLQSSTNRIALQFISDDTDTSSGFRIHYSLANCNTTYEVDSANMQRPRSLQDNCYTKIAATNNRYITLYFSYLHLSNSNNDGSFKVFDGEDSSSTLLADLRGYLTPDPIYSTGSKLYIEVIQPRNNIVSYMMNYATSESPNGCGGRFFGKRSIFTSPSYPGIPATNLTCTYTVAVPSNFHAAIRIGTWDFGGGGGCNSTYLELYDVFADNSARLFTTLCEGDEPADHLSPSNRLIVRYVTGPIAVTGTGWRAITMEVTPHADTVFDIQEPTTVAP